MTTPLTVVFYGKGGAGKSMVASHVSAAWAIEGRRVLHVGCDPKADSTLRLRDVDDTRCLVDFLEDKTLAKRRPDELLVPGRWGIDTLEAGGPDPGRGCAGRIVSVLVEYLEEHGVLSRGYDRVVFDVLGDLVCGGFVAPMWPGFADRVVVVASADPMSLFSANNIARTVRDRLDDGVRTAGIVYNLRGASAGSRAVLEAFAARVSLPVLGWLEWDPLVAETEHQGRTLFDGHADAPTARALRELAQRLATGEAGPAPTPMDRREMLLFGRTLRG